MRTIHRLDSVGSTMTHAAEFAAAGCASGTVVVAEEQTAGQGRHGHAWHSERGAGLYLSVVLRHKINTDSLPIVTLALGLAAAETIADAAAVLCDLRWPNDVLINGRKCAGILVQLHDGVLIAGIGINVNHTAFPPDLRDTATSLRIETAREHSRERLLDALLPKIDDQMERLMTEGKAPILRAFAAASSYVAGRRVLVDGKREGTTDGLDPQGFLILREDSGRRSLVLAGGVRSI